MKTPVVVFLALLSLAGCMKQKTAETPAAAHDPAAVRAVIESLNQKFAAALVAHDSAGLAANYAAEAVVLAPNEPSFSGAERLALSAAAMAKMPVTRFTPTTLDVIVQGDLAVETGSYVWTMQQPGGHAMSDTGKYLTVWRQQADGSWKIIRDMNSSNRPPSAP
jgi:uncharacterized protein (TIGR02246 family)